MPPSQRSRLLLAAGRTPHRYARYRALNQVLGLLLLLAVPLSGVARVDLWAGHHLLAFAPAGFKPALAGVIAGIALLYVVTFLSNVGFGRMFCGWGCPIGQVSRFGERVQWARSARERLGMTALGALFSCALVVAMLAWWIDLRAFLAAPGPLRVALVAGVIAAVAILHLHGRLWRWEFCKQACPIGAYYTFLSPTRWFGIHFRDAGRLCIDCDGCDRVCPVDLAPRDLLAPVGARGGISIADAPGRNHCLECGDCVRVCEMVLARRRERGIPLRLGAYRGNQSERVQDGRARAA